MSSSWNDIELVLRAGPLSLAADHPSAEVLARFADAPSTLPGDDLASLEHHLENCRACRTDLAALRRFDFSAGARLAEEATTAVAAKTREREQKAERVGSPLKNWVVERLTGAGWALPMAAAAALLLAFYFSMAGSRGPSVSPGMDGEATKPAIAAADDPELRNPDRAVDPRESEVLSKDSIQVADEPPSSTPSPFVESPSPSAASPEPQSSPRTLVADGQGQDSPQAIPRAGSPIEEQSPPADAPHEEILIASYKALGDPSYAVPSAADGLPFAVPDRNVILRSSDPSDVQIAALSPRHAGRTISESPSLWWYLSQDTDKPIRFQLVDQKSIDPVVEQVLAGPTRAGFHSVDLAAFGVSLETGQLYEWSVMVEIDPEHPLSNPRSYGAIVRLQKDPVPAATPKAARAHAEAQAGIWYDAFGAIAERADRHAEDDGLVRQRAALLRSAGIEIPIGTRNPF